MKKYSVVFEDSAQVDMQASYNWGCKVWGKAKAQNWVRDVRTVTKKQLGTLPAAHPIAPENDEFAEEIRHLVVGRYRILFTIRGKKVHVLHIRGAFSHGSESSGEDEE
jgi:plasmid stabilization system protein ParE